MQQQGGVRSLLERHFGWAWVVGLVMSVATVVFSVIQELPIRDPDSVIPGYIRFPLIVLTAIAADVVPRVVWRSRHSLRSFKENWRTVLKERWPASHWVFAVGGVSAWYLTYAAFRNLKSMVPFINSTNWDREFAALDRALWFGHDPAVVLHDIFGKGIAAHFFSGVYFIWIALIPISIAIALVWTRNTRGGAWYVTALAFDWFLGAVVYILFPSMGPVFNAQQRGEFSDLPRTYNTQLVETLWDDRVAVISDRFSAGLQTIAAFPSLHVGMMVTICLSVTLMGLKKWIQVASWVFLVLTIFATLYLGWHFFIDVIGGAAVGSFAVWAAALATGNHVGLRPQLTESPAPADDVSPLNAAS